MFTPARLMVSIQSVRGSIAGSVRASSDGCRHRNAAWLADGERGL
jgi:uncharacterized protein (TIGR02453 family)